MRGPCKHLNVLQPEPDRQDAQILEVDSGDGRGQSPPAKSRDGVTATEHLSMRIQGL